MTAWWREPSRGQWASFVAAWLGWVLDAFDFTIFLLVMKQIAAEFGETYVATAGSIALTLLTRLLGAVVAGWAADRFGRKWPLMISIAWFAVCDGLVSLAPSFGWVLALRTLFGFGMGAEWTAGATLAMENWPERTRGLASGVLQGSWAIGYLLAGVVAGAVVPTWGWRALFLIAAVPALLVLPIRAFVPESEAWTASRAQANARVSWRALLATPGVLRRLIWSAGFLAAGFCGYYALTGTYAVLLQDSFSQTLPQVSWHVALFNVGMLVGAAACGALAMKKGVPLAVGLAAGLMVVATPLYVGAMPAWLAVGAFAGGVFGAGSSGTTPLLLTSLFPTAVRARAVGLAYQLGAVPAAFVPMAIAALSSAKILSLQESMALASVAAQTLVIAMLLIRPR